MYYAALLIRRLLSITLLLQPLICFAEEWSAPASQALPLFDYRFRSFFETIKKIQTQPDGTLRAIDSSGTVLQRSGDGTDTRWTRRLPANLELVRDAVFSRDGQQIWVIGEEANNIWRSVDGGMHWVILPTFTDGKLYTLALSPDGNTLWTGGADGSLFRSRDNGMRWEPVSTGTTATITTIHLTANGQKIFVGGTLGYIASGTPTANNLGTRAFCDGYETVFAIATSHSADNAIAAGEFGQLCASSDGGETWVSQRPEDDDGFDFDFYAIAYDAARDQFIAVGDTARVAVQQNGKWHTIVVGITRDNLNSLEVDGARLIAGGAGGTIIRSDDGGLHWRALDDVGGIHGQFMDVAVSRDGMSVIASSSRGAVYLSNDGGKNFAVSYLEGSGRNQPNIAMSADGRVAFASMSSGRIFRWTFSDDWKLLPARLKSGTFALKANEDGSTLISVQRDGQVIKLSVIDMTSRIVLRGSKDERFYALSGSWDGRHMLVGGSGQRVHVSDNYGDTWRPVKLPKDDTLISLDWSDDISLAGAINGHFFLSSDGGSTWTHFDSGSDNRIGAIAHANKSRWLAFGRSARVSYDGGKTSAQQRSFLGEISAMASPETGSKLWVVTDTHEMGYFEPSEVQFPRIVSASIPTILNKTLSNEMELRFSTKPQCRKTTLSVKAKISSAVGSSGDIDLKQLFKDGSRVRFRFDLPKETPAPPFDLVVTLSCPGYNYEHVFPNRMLSSWVDSVPGGARTFWLIGAFVAFPMASFVLYILSPVSLLGLRNLMALDVWPAFFKPILVFLSLYLLTNLLCKRPRVLQAWVDSQRKPAITHWSTVQQMQRAGYTPLPVRLSTFDDEISTVNAPTAEAFAPILGTRPLVLEIVGIAGAGKTMLSVQLGAWMLDGTLLRHRAVPIMLSNPSAKSMEDELLQKIRSIFGDATPPRDLLTSLLSNGYIVPIVDRLSERGHTYQESLTDCTFDFSLLIVTSRVHRTWDWPVAVAAPLFIHSLPVLAYYVQHEVSAMADSGTTVTVVELADIVAALVIRFGRGSVTQDPPITPLLAQKFARLAHELLRKAGNLAQLPASSGLVYFEYIRLIINREFTEGNGSTVMTALSTLALQATANGVGPQAITYEKALSIFHSNLLGVSAVNATERVVSLGVLRKIERIGITRIAFVTDTFAEVLTASYIHAHKDDMTEMLAMFEKARCQSENAAVSAAAILKYIDEFDIL